MACAVQPCSKNQNASRTITCMIRGAAVPVTVPKPFRFAGKTELGTELVLVGLEKLMVLLIPLNCV